MSLTYCKQTMRLRESAGDADKASIRYKDMPVIHVTLSMLCKLYEKGMAKAVFNLLRVQTKINIDAKYQYDPVGPDLIFDINHHFLDFMLVLSKGIRFDTILPHTHSDQLLFSASIYTSPLHA